MYIAAILLLDHKSDEYFNVDKDESSDIAKKNAD